ncbi:MAG TPA: kelch repeat-containing protein [Terriglobales bacterium]|nr:kelch repeat-containing protein [Terriglobales bacterium]
MLRRLRMFASAFLSLALATFLFSNFASAANVPTVSWSQLSPTTAPTARSYAAAAYDPVSKKIVVFGGFSSRGYLNETWTFDGTNWAKVNASTAPPVRTNASMAYDKVSRKVVLFGGYNGQNYLGDTWLWDGSNSTWTNANPAHAPKAVTGPMLFTDPANGHADANGGFDGRLYQATTYQWTGSDWQNLNPTTEAYARSIAVAALDGAMTDVVMFDGLGDLNPYNTWTWDGTNWTMQSPTTQPPSRYGAPGAYDPPHKAVITFGGGEGGIDIGDTWAWTTAKNWVQLTPTTSPTAREGHNMVWDPVIGHVVLIGGQSGPENNPTYLNDTWVLDPH